ncbi:MAG: LysR family transcriptional regulator, partial [Novosphingobium sp.]|nr:LysR family transcriptional regulator [Novosphingobium sp.]
MTALKSFEAAARLNSFTLAADELNVTQGAISRQIKLLESILNVTLFDRKNQQVVLTEAGRYYAQHVAESLHYLKSAATQTIAFAQPGHQLHIGIVPAFGSRWIIPRLRGFASEYPQVHLRLSTISGGDLAFALDEFDIALVVGVGDWPKAMVHQLEKEELVAVAAPPWIEKFNIRSPGDLIGPPLLVHTDRPTLWSKWFDINDIDAGALVPAPLALEQIVMIIEAANAQLGAA